MNTHTLLARTPKGIPTLENSSAVKHIFTIYDGQFHVSAWLSQAKH